MMDDTMSYGLKETMYNNLQHWQQVAANRQKIMEEQRVKIEDLQATIEELETSNVCEASTEMKITLEEARREFVILCADQWDRVPEQIRKLKARREDEGRLLRLEQQKNDDLLDFIQRQDQAHAEQLKALQLTIGAMDAHSKVMKTKSEAKLMSAGQKSEIMIASIWASLGQTTVRWLAGAGAISSALYCLI